MVYTLINIKHQQAVNWALTILFFALQNWHLGLRKPFRSLKLWFVMRCFGLKNIQAQIRHVKDETFHKMGDKYKILKGSDFFLGN